jgi:transposase
MLPAGVNVFLSLEPTDMRRSFTGLTLLVKDVLEQDPFTGHLFVFTNRRGDKVKVLYWGVSRA